ncbi:transcription factor BHLH3-like [Typha angustifolia]|uniref:transcription factor BHLH3-like n=1 Tax=Typha angustifolia TaxID=59011 RepID=UPI003C2CC5B7
MVSREHKRGGLHEKLQILRSITNSHAVNKASVIVDASKYIQELKKKVMRLNQEIDFAQNNIEKTPLPMVSVENLGRGFLINVFSAKSFPGLLVSILEAFEELGLNLLEARASCTNTFRLKAVGGENQIESVDVGVVEQAVLQAIKNCSGTGEEE